MPGEQLSKAFARVQLTDLFNPEATLVDGLLNPTTLSYGRQVDIGELSPVNWSNSVLMYGSTKSASIPLEFYFSTQLTPRVGGPVQALTYYIDFFDSFCFPIDRGGAPPVMLLLWPRVLEAALVISSFNASLERFYADSLEVQAVTVSVQTRELRFAFRTAADHRKLGMRQIDPVARGYYGVGNPLNLKSRR